MDARHRIRIIAAAAAVAALTGGRAAAQEDGTDTPDTELGRAAQECIDVLISGTARSTTSRSTTMG